MNQMPVKWAPHMLLTDNQIEGWSVLQVPVIELSVLREVVEGLKYIEDVLCERKLCGHFTAEEIRQETQRLLARLGEK